MSELMRMSVNENLSAARVVRGLTLAQVASELNLPVSVILAIEEGRYDSLHGEAFVCGVLRAYAGMIGLDSEALLKAYKEEAGSQIETPKNVDNVIINAHLSWQNLVSTRMISEHMQYRTAYGIVAIIALAVIIKVCNMDAGSYVENPVETSITIDTSMGKTIVSSLGELPIVNPTQDFIPEVTLLNVGQAGSLVNPVAGFEKVINSDNDKNMASLSFAFVADCWVEVLDGNNQIIFASMQNANNKLVLAGKPPFRITLGYAPGVELSYNSRMVPISADSANMAKLVLGNS